MLFGDATRAPFDALTRPDRIGGESRLRLRTMLRLRWIAVVGQLFAVLFVSVWLDFDLGLGVCLVVVGVSAAFNIMLQLSYPIGHRLRMRYATAMLIYDVLQLTLLLFLTGGLQNPFSILLLAPVSVSAATQPRRITMVLVLLAVLAATLLLFFSLPLPWYSGEVFDLPWLYRIGLWVGISSSIIFIGFYTSQISSEARRMSDAIAATEMVLAREQQLSALDGLAAAAAHELGTPLSTISVVAKELLHDLPEGSEASEDVALLRAQAERCRTILATLTERKNESDEMYMRFSLGHMLEDVISPHRWPGVEIEVLLEPCSGTSEALVGEPLLERNSSILYALGNIVENAVDFAESHVLVVGRWDDHYLTITIQDDGPGFSAQILDNIGEPYLTTRSSHDPDRPHDEHGGMGLGFFIAKTFLERSRAEVACSNRKSPESGAVIQITWQRSQIDVSGKAETSRF